MRAKQQDRSWVGRAVVIAATLASASASAADYATITPPPLSPATVADSHADYASTTRIRWLLWRLYRDAWSGQADALDDVIAQNLIDHASNGGRAGFAGAIAALRDGIPALHVRIARVSISNDVVRVLVIGSGWQDGVLFGQMPTHKKIVFQQFDQFRVSGGLFREHWGSLDMATIPVVAPQ